MQAILALLSSVQCAAACCVYAAQELEQGDAAALAARAAWLAKIVDEQGRWHLYAGEALAALRQAAADAAAAERAAEERAAVEEAPF